MAASAAASSGAAWTAVISRARRPRSSSDVMM